MFALRLVLEHVVYVQSNFTTIFMKNIIHFTSRSACMINLAYLFSFLMQYIKISGHFPLQSVHCLIWICLDVLFCTASIMHLSTISVDRYLSLRFPLRFGRNKTRRRVILKIIFVWILSIAMSLPLSLMYSKVSLNFVLQKFKIN